MFLTFQNGVKNIQTAGYNGAHTVARLTITPSGDIEKLPLDILTPSKL